MHGMEMETYGNQPKCSNAGCSNMAFKSLIVLSVISTFTAVISVISLLLTVRLNSDLSDLYGTVHSLRQELKDSTSDTNGISSTSKKTHKNSFIIRGFDTSEGFNITVDFPDSFVISGGFSELECNSTFKRLENVIEDIKTRSGTQTCGPNGNLGDSVLKAIQQLDASISNIKNTQEIILMKINKSSTGSQSSSIQNLVNVFTQQTVSIQNRLGDLEAIVLESKSDTRQLQSSLRKLQSDASKIKLDTGLVKLDVASIKSNTDKQDGGSNCADDLSPILMNLRTKVDDIGIKTEKVQQSLTKREKSLSTIADSLSGNFRKLETSTTEMKDKCSASEIKLAEVLAKVGVPTEPPTATFAQVTISYCSSKNGCKLSRVATTHCYIVSKTQDKSWYSAREECGRLGGYLAEIDSEVESREIAGMLTHEGQYWIGGTDKAQGGRWQWNHSGRSVSLSAWQSREPSTSSGFDCMALDKDGWSWTATICDSKRGYVCEKEANDCRDWLLD